MAVVDRGVIAREERYLEHRFGDAYTAYRARVRRWL
jgi:protein-S-isoprenylcysteine O-methyltransferase Ste14